MLEKTENIPREFQQSKTVSLLYRPTLNIIRYTVAATS